MKTKQLYLFLLTGLIALAGCEDKIYETYMANTPVYMTYEDLRSAVEVEPSRPMEKPGKIYFKDNYIFINEQMEGVHIFNVQNPSNPTEVGFIKIPGNVDIAIKEDILYADSYVDLVAVDVSDLANVEEVGRIEDVFPYIVPEFDPDYRMAQVDQEKGVVVEWEVKEVRERLEKVDYPYPVYYYEAYRDYAGSINMTDAGGVGGGSGTTFGVGGSMARFGLYEDYLYVVGDYQLYTIKINDLDNPVTLNTQNAGWGIETMFIYDDHMFLGTTSGMLIFTLEAPGSPSFVKQFTHITSCDPVVVQNDLAYVTLHDGGWCGRSVNRLDVIQMTNNYNTLTQIASYPMTNPHGLGIDGDLLFICDGSDGLKVYDASDPLMISSRMLASFPEVQPIDVIPLNDYLFAIGDDGFYLYDYSNIQDIQLLSEIPVSGQND